jgi:hypothetical protein
VAVPVSSPRGIGKFLHERYEVVRMTAHLNIIGLEAESSYIKTVIPDAFTRGERDPESGRYKGNQ